jgi:hypothetical protein
VLQVRPEQKQEGDDHDRERVVENPLKRSHSLKECLREVFFSL